MGIYVTCHRRALPTVTKLTASAESPHDERQPKYLHRWVISNTITLRDKQGTSLCTSNRPLPLHSELSLASAHFLGSIQVTLSKQSTFHSHNTTEDLNPYKWFLSYSSSYPRRCHSHQLVWMTKWRLLSSFFSPGFEIRHYSAQPATDKQHWLILSSIPFSPRHTLIYKSQPAVIQ